MKCKRMDLQVQALDPISKTPLDHTDILGLIFTTSLCLKLTILTYGSGADKKVWIYRCKHQLAFSSSWFHLQIGFLHQSYSISLFLSIVRCIWITVLASSFKVTFVVWLNHLLDINYLSCESLWPFFFSFSVRIWFTQMSFQCSDNVTSEDWILMCTDYGEQSTIMGLAINRQTIGSIHRCLCLPLHMLQTCFLTKKIAMWCWVKSWTTFPPNFLSKKSKYSMFIVGGVVQLVCSYSCCASSLYVSISHTDVQPQVSP